MVYMGILEAEGVKMKKYLVTGGTGFIGSAVVKALAKKGNFVRILDNNARGAAESLKDAVGKIEIAQADIRDPESVRKACRGMDSVVHLAYINGTQFFYEKPELVLEVAIKGIVNVIDGCIKENVPELVLASSSEVYNNPAKIPTDEKAAMVVPDPLNPRYSYSSGKIISEMMAINYGRKHIKRVLIFRPHNVYGPNMGWEHVIPQMVTRMKKMPGKKIKFSIQGTGKETRAFVFIDDFVEGFLLMLEKGEHLGIYNIGTMSETAISDLVKEIGKYFGKDVIIVPGEVAKGSPTRRCPDTTKLKKLGFKTRTPFREGLRITAKWYDQNSEKQPKISQDRGKLYEK